MSNWPEDPTDYRRLLAFMMHELRRIHSELDANAIVLSQGIRNERVDVSRIRSAVPVLQEEILVLHSWLAIADFYLDPSQFARETKHRLSLHELFYKTRIVLARRARAKVVTVHLVGQGKFYINAHRIVGVLPYILLDNAFKYTITGGRVTVSFEEILDRHEVAVKSVGPYVPPEELSRLGEVGFRGSGAQAVTSIGNGQGLALLRSICLYHDADVSFSSDDKTRIFNDLPYSEFVVTLKFRKA